MFNDYNIVNIFILFIMQLDSLHNKVEEIAQKAAILSFQPELSFPVVVVDTNKQNMTSLEDFTELYDYLNNGNAIDGVSFFKDIHISIDAQNQAKDFDEFVYLMGLNNNHPQYLELPMFRSLESQMLATTKVAVESSLEFVLDQVEGKNIAQEVSQQIHQGTIDGLASTSLVNYVGQVNMSDENRDVFLQHIKDGITCGLKDLQTEANTLSLQQKNKVKP